MPEGLVKISSSLYESILPLVKQQVDSQIKVRDFSAAKVHLQPAEFSSWGDARSEMMIEAKRYASTIAMLSCHLLTFHSVARRPLKAQLTAELAAAADDDQRETITAAFASREKALEHDLDHKPMDVHMTIDVSYNFLSK